MPGSQSLAAIMQLDAPSRGTLQDLYNLIEACNFHLATEVINNAPNYMEPALANAPLPEVRASYAFVLLAQCQELLQTSAGAACFCSHCFDWQTSILLELVALSHSNL